MKQLSEAQIRELAAIDSPTISNAIEKFEVRNPVEGFTGPEIKCLSPGLGAMLGYVVTVAADTTTPSTSKEHTMHELFAAVEKSPKPVVLVIKAEGLQPIRTCPFGDMIGLTLQRLGAVGVVTDGCVRDVPQLRRAGFHVFAAGTVASHGIPALRKVNVPVDIGGLRLAAEDIVHGDENGIVKIPGECIDGLAEEVQRILAEEESVVEAINSPEFPDSVMPYFGVND